MNQTHKIIVIAGARSKVGKTALALQLLGLLDNSEAVKIGDGKKKPELNYHREQFDSA